MWALRAMLVAACVAVTVIGVAPAYAAFPGANGKFVYSDPRPSERWVPIRTSTPGDTGLGTVLTEEGGSPTWSADGTKIAFERGPFFNAHVLVMNEDGSGESVVTNTSDEFVELEPDWSPDGRIAFTRAPSQVFVVECSSLWSIGADGTGAQELLTPDEGPCYKRHAAWSPDGSLIAFSGGPTGRFNAGAPTEIYTVHPDGTGLTQITSAGSSAASQPDWSPGSDEIAYRLAVPSSPDVGGWGFELRVMNRDGSNDRFLRLGGLISGNIDEPLVEPAWSPDGTLIAFHDEESLDGDAGLYAIRPDGTDVRPLHVPPGPPQGLGIPHADPDWQRVEPPPPPDPRDCHGVFTGVTLRNVTVRTNRACTLIDSTVTGRVDVKRNAHFEADNTDIARRLQAIGAQTVSIHDGSSLGAGLRVYRTTGVVDVSGNTIDGDVVVAYNRPDVELAIRGNTIAGDLIVTSNRGPAEKFVESNTGGQRLECKRNEPPFVASGNLGWDTQKGQCSGP